jgi:hypothetical protein
VPFTLADFAVIRPYLYHLTARQNLGAIRAERRIVSAAALLRAAGRESHLGDKRDDMLAVSIGDRIAVLRDQAPLHRGNVGLAPGWTFESLLDDLNRRVFFWPGTAPGPIDYGLRHFARYTAHPTYESVILRVPTAALLRANPDRPPLFCPYNSGSPRFSSGRASPRGPDTFLPADRFPGPAGRVVEVTFLDQVDLPDDTAVLPLTAGTVAIRMLVGVWSPLFHPAGEPAAVPAGERMRER